MQNGRKKYKRVNNYKTYTVSETVSKYASNNYISK